MLFIESYYTITLPFVNYFFVFLCKFILFSYVCFKCSMLALPLVGVKGRAPWDNPLRCLRLDNQAARAQKPANKYTCLRPCRKTKKTRTFDDVFDGAQFSLSCEIISILWGNGMHNQREIGVVLSRSATPPKGFSLDNTKTISQTGCIPLPYTR